MYVSKNSMGKKKWKNLRSKPGPTHFSFEQQGRVVDPIPSYCQGRRNLRKPCDESCLFYSQSTGVNITQLQLKWLIDWLVLGFGNRRCAVQSVGVARSMMIDLRGGSELQFGVAIQISPKFLWNLSVSDPKNWTNICAILQRSQGRREN